MKARTKSTLKKFAEEQKTRTCSRLAAEKCGKDGPVGTACCSRIKADPRVVGGFRVLGALDDFGRERLSKHYFMRDFLYSEISQVHGIPNVPEDADLAVKAGKALCRNLLEPLRHVFGHVTIRSAFRSASVNGFCNCHNMNCSSNKASYANHIWDHRDGDGFMGATACIVIPWFADWMNEKQGRDWRVLAWFIHNHLPYSEMVFFIEHAAVNLTWRGDPDDAAQDGDVLEFDGSRGSISWRSEPRRYVKSFQEPKGLLIKNGELKGHAPNDHYDDCLRDLCSDRPALSDYLKVLQAAKTEEDERFGRLV
ncbi:MAG: hypothetical protein F4112_00410 [Holophagales bacterium]|nr:hypothetical protein [Holophagales bacterium]MYD23526.1 hypothetical protein [Holophagales bacterium]MYI31406.1 hypothetical protein [Holophagales bacterium]